MSVREDNSLLLELAQSGDEHAIALLFEQYRDRLKKMIALRMDARIRSRCDASDILQESFIEFSRRLPDFDEKKGSSFFVWLRRITFARLSKLHRKHLGTHIRNANREVSLNNWAGAEASSQYLATQMAGQFTSVHRNLVRAELEAKIRSTLESMDPNDREILALRHFEEMSTAEIVEVLGLTRSGVLKRYARALARLSEEINLEPDSNWNN